MPAIKAIVRMVHRRFVRTRDDERELLSDVVFHLIRNDYAVLRQFRGGSSLRTYLRTVIGRVQLDRQVRAWGKWRPTTRARSLGKPASTLERLVLRDHLSPQDAIGLVVHHSSGEIDPETAHNLYAAIAPRPRPRPVSLECLGERIAAPPDRDPCALSDLRSRAARITLALQRALASLDAGDRQLVHRRYVKGETVADISRATGLDQRRLYRDYERILRRLRAQLRHRAVLPEEALLVVGHPDVELGSIFPPAVSAA
jgi:RNA polymerase sigma factor (sigma-70 family)